MALSLKHSNQGRLVAMVSKVTMFIDIAIMPKETLVTLLTKLKLITIQPVVTSVK